MRGAGAAGAGAGAAPGAASGGYGVLIAHPSRREAARLTATRLAARLAMERPGYVLWTLQTPMEPVLAHARRVPAGATFRLVPLLLAPGAHYDGDVADLAEEVRHAAPSLRVEVAPPLLEDEGFLGWLFSRL